MSVTRRSLRVVRPAHLAVALAVLALAWTGPSSSARAAGFQLKEQSASALGNAFAGATSGVEDLSYMFFNPASMAYQSGSQALAVGSVIVPSSEMQSGSASTVVGTPISGGLGGDAGGAVATGALYAMWDFDPRLKVGLGITTPFGLQTEYDDGWIGRYHGVKSELKTININPAVAYKIAPWISVGAGAQLQYADAELSQALDFGTLGAILGIGGASPGSVSQDGAAKLEGDDWALGFNLGVLVEPLPGTRFGVGYRSAISHEIEGDATFDTGGAIGAAVAGAGVFGPFANTSAKAKLKTPQILSFGAHHDLTPQLAIMAEAAWTDWSTFRELRVQFDNAQSDSVTTENWDDSWFFAGGVTWRPTTQLTVRGGVAFDRTPIPDATRTPRIPGADRTWIAIGGGYEITPIITVDAGYTHIFVDDARVNLTTVALPATDENTARGNLSGTYENSVDILTLQLVVRF